MPSLHKRMDFRLDIGFFQEILLKFQLSTFISCINEWKKTLEIDEVVFVADRGMFSSQNLFAIQTVGYKFVGVCPLRKLGKKIENEIFQSENHRLGIIENLDEVIWNKKLKHRFYKQELKSLFMS